MAPTSDRWSVRAYLAGAALLWLVVSSAPAQDTTGVPASSTPVRLGALGRCWDTWDAARMRGDPSESRRDALTACYRRAGGSQAFEWPGDDFDAAAIAGCLRQRERAGSMHPWVDALACELLGQYPDPEELHSGVDLAPEGDVWLSGVRTYSVYQYDLVRSAAASDVVAALAACPRPARGVFVLATDVTAVRVARVPRPEDVGSPEVTACIASALARTASPLGDDARIYAMVYVALE
jgi:hypothetical protein